MSINFKWLEEKFFNRKLTEREKVILGEMTEHRLRQSERLIEQGQAGGKLYILHAGKLGVEVTKEGVRSYLIDVQEGDLVGEMSFLSGKESKADVIAMENCVVYTLSKEQFEIIMNNSRHVRIFRHMLV